MATLLELTSQGDVATITDESKLSRVRLMEPQQLYELWERQPWSAHGIDLEQDVRDWAELPEADRHDVVWGLSSFFVGEERVTTQFSGLVMAYEDQAEEAYLTTQQVDEARHAQHFSRFYAQVMDIGGGMDAQLARVRADLNDAFVTLFDHHLVEAARKLIADPADREAKVDFVTTYHMIIEGTLALTGQNFITDWMEKRGIFPGFLEGFRNISRDEHRHVAYGTWYLQQAARDPALAERMQAKIAELLPLAASVLVPRGKDPFGEWDLLGYTSAEVNGFAFTALTRRLKVIGVGLPDLSGAAASV
jgi:ribonucleoside-diphosphate reductase beta chain